jgi:hypothetical protein
MSFSNYVLCPQIQYVKSRAKFRACDAEDIFDFLNSHVQKLKLGHLVEFRKYRAPHEVEKSESDSEAKRRTMAV